MTTQSIIPVPDVEPDELETTPMTDAQHQAAFDWAWDDPAKAEAGV